MRVLFLSQRAPYPPNRGDKITTWRIVERLQREHEVTVISFAHDEDDREAAAELRAKGISTIDIPHDERMKKLASLPLLLTRKPLTLGVYGSGKLQAEVDRRVGQTDAAYAYSSSMGAFLAHHDVPWVMHFAELDSDKWSQYAGRTGWPMSWVYRREARTLEAYERDLARRSAANVFCTPLEERIFQDRIPGFPSTVMRNGVDLEFFSPSPSTAEAGHLVFTGVMDYYPNVDGCVWFVNEILPRIREHHPDVRFSIVGSRPNAEVQRLATTPGVEVTGFVDDTRDWLRRASLAVAPLRIARGIQNKVLESLAMGLPTVGTTCATQGVSGSAGEDYLVADDAEGFARAVVSLLDAPDRAGDLAREGRRFVEEHYDWERTLAPLEELLSLCSDRSSAS